MKGLDYDEYSKYYSNKKDYNLLDRIRLINSFMKYQIEHDDRKSESSDALQIAKILGVEPKTIEYAAKMLYGFLEVKTKIFK